MRGGEWARWPEEEKEKTALAVTATVSDSTAGIRWPDEAQSGPTECVRWARQLSATRGAVSS